MSDKRMQTEWVKKEWLDDYWPAAKVFIEAASATHPSADDVLTIKRRLQTDPNHHLVVYWWGKVIVGAAVLDHEPASREIHITSLAWANMPQPLEARLRQVWWNMKITGAQWVTLRGRRGWQRLLAKYWPVQIQSDGTVRVPLCL